MSAIEVRTDLALEAREDIKPEKGIIDGVIVNIYSEPCSIKVSKVSIINEQGSQLMKKPMGSYYTIEAGELVDADNETREEIIKVLSKYIYEIGKTQTKDIHNATVLVVGLGNREVTPDAIGPNAVDALYITERLLGVAPGVLAQTGIETARIIRGIADEVKPDIIIAIDALAARSTKRLNSTIQLSDTGINPGSGVGNHRWAINVDSIGVPVISIGVPTVVDAPTIISDSLEQLFGELELNAYYKKIPEDKKYTFVKEIISPEIANMFVTPKDVDEASRMIGFVIADAINHTFVAE